MFDLAHIRAVTKWTLADNNDAKISQIGVEVGGVTVATRSSAAIEPLADSLRETGYIITVSNHDPLIAITGYRAPLAETHPAAEEGRLSVTCPLCGDVSVFAVTDVGALVECPHCPGRSTINTPTFGSD